MGRYPWPVHSSIRYGRAGFAVWDSITVSAAGRLLPDTLNGDDDDTRHEHEMWLLVFTGGGAGLCPGASKTLAVSAWSGGRSRVPDEAHCRPTRHRRKMKLNGVLRADHSEPQTTSVGRSALMTPESTSRSEPAATYLAYGQAHQTCGQGGGAYLCTLSA